jgi:hypothetical protein
MKGRYFAGDFKRTDMEEFTFMDILENLAIHLKKQNYNADPKNGEGDLLLVVHYGVTRDKTRFDKYLQSRGLPNNPPWSTEFKATLLGMEEAYDWKREFNEIDLEMMIEEPRFFVIVIAYDLPQAKQGKSFVH